MKVYTFLVTFFILLQANGQIEKIKILKNDTNEDVVVPEKYKPYLTVEQIKEFEYGADKRTNENCRIYFISWYKWNNDKIIKVGDGYYYTDVLVGPARVYFASGNISKEGSNVIINDRSKKIISMEKFNAHRNPIKLWKRGYSGVPHGTWKYYSEEGKLIKEEEYDKGALIKTTTY